MPVFLPWLAIWQGPRLRHSERFDGRRWTAETVLFNCNDPDQCREFHERNDKEVVWLPDSRYLFTYPMFLQAFWSNCLTLETLRAGYREGEAVSFTGHRRGGPERHSVPPRSCPAGRRNSTGDNYFGLSFQLPT
jgi:hypothetical protein